MSVCSGGGEKSKAMFALSKMLSLAGGEAMKQVYQKLKKLTQGYKKDKVLHPAKCLMLNSTGRCSMGRQPQKTQQYCCLKLCLKHTETTNERLTKLKVNRCPFLKGL